LHALTGSPPGFTQIDLVLHDDADPDAVVAARRDALPAGAMIQTTEKITSGLDANLRSGELGFVLAAVLALLSATFIILTGLTTSVTERQRELAIIRCVGGTRAQLGLMQLSIGLVV